MTGTKIIPNAIHALSIPMATFLFMLVFVSPPVELGNLVVFIYCDKYEVREFLVSFDPCFDLERKLLHVAPLGLRSGVSVSL